MKVWETVCFISQTIAANVAIIVIALYLIFLSLWSDSCGDIPFYLLLIGIAMLICSLYYPFYTYGKKKAIQDRQNRIHSLLEPIYEGEITSEEIIKFIPRYLHNICNAAVTVLFGICAPTTYYTFQMFFSRHECPAITYWTSFVISVFDIIVLVAILGACFSCCCLIIVVHVFCKSDEGNEVDIEA
ncbi:Serpentine Receptor, class E (Epsilon) [Caenorhabditis elegans]|uniref:Serpentine Receptor, class E (Epsilon) n=1 Tax=Caenorhabditis elegans TaxID=6239 RepID=A0A1N7SZG0_CAEEL|nr:Serpentine Receptor, class E (Epsilon) [Caenorhabditis elegans]SIT60447.1 Serpentine Receptor, class E (Epsilon) [Caenorhabditis elegans]|eukprot:NP_001335557.1 Uncharacterized protein CELE_T04C12.33 [Caenorhabditis elegans]